MIKAEGHRGYVGGEGDIKGIIPIYQPGPQNFYQNYTKKSAATIRYFYETFFMILGHRPHGFGSQKVFW